MFPVVAFAALAACGGGGSSTPPTYSIGGTLTGLDAGQSIMLQDNGTDTLTISANSPFTFATKLPSGASYAVAVSQGPKGETCTVTGGSGTASANINSVAVACHSNATFSIGGSVTGLGKGLSLVLQDNGAETLTLGDDGAFTFATKVASGGAYAVTVLTQPSGKTCAVAGGSGTASADVNNIAVACAAPYTVGGTVSGLVGQGLQISLDSQPLAINANGPFVFPAIEPGSFGHGVYVKQQPVSPAQLCIVQNPYFTVTPFNAANISDVNVVCGEFSIVAHSSAGTVSEYSVDATTGAFSSLVPPLSVGTSPSAIAGTTDKKFLYISNGGTNDVAAFRVDPGSGALTVIPGSPFAAGMNPGAISIYTATIGTERGNHNSLLSYLYVANAASNNLSAYQIDQGTGVLTPLIQSSYATGLGPSTMISRFEGSFLYIADSGGSNDITAYLIDGFSGGLTPVLGSPFPAAGHITALAFGPGETFLYAANAGAGAAGILGFAIRPYIDPTARDPNPDFGALKTLPGSPWALPSCTYIVSDQTGTYLYATAGSSVFGYSINPQTGALGPLQGFPVAIGAAADSLTIDPSNQFLYVKNDGAGTVTGFRLNTATGGLTLIPTSPFSVGQSADFLATF
jgi:6-phosphogluconolactonase (cycloisomerase 2 family)